MLKIKDKNTCEYDIISLGEVMLRLDPGEGRIKTTRAFKASEGGGEYNVARGLRKCFNQRAGVVTSFVKNDLGLLLEDLILQGGVDTRFIKWLKHDGIGRTRNGLNFTERGYGVRAALGVSDRCHTAISSLKKGDIDWDGIFSKGVRWFHTGGIFAALSDSTADVAQEAMIAAKKHGTIISYDLNYRPSLWDDKGGTARAQEVNKELAKYVDVMIGNEEDFTVCLGFEVPNTDSNLSNLEVDNFKSMINEVYKKYNNFKVIATTMRTVVTASINHWGAICFMNGNFYESFHRKNLEILDRVGGGDSFASGFIYGLLSNLSPELAINYGASHGALAMTTAGDTSMASLEEVESLVKGKSARVKR